MDDDDEVLRKRNDLEMMRRVHLWPSGGVLCLKNRKLGEEGGWPLFAIMVFDPENGLYHFRLREGNTKERRVGDDALLQELIAEGWVVD